MSVTVLFFAAALATSAPASRQPTPAPKPSSNSADDRLATAAVPRTVSVEGCVALESEITGRKATLGERTGLDRHFVLAKGKVVKGKAPAVPDVEAAGMAPVYKISGLTDEQLKVHVGRRVRIEGTFGDHSRAAEPVDASEASDESEFVELNVATIRQIPGVCSLPRS